MPMVFQSTLSMRRATIGRRDQERGRQISIHALHEESDPFLRRERDLSTFQSTLSMRRATHDLHAMPELLVRFQSTLSMRRATTSTPKFTLRVIFQSTLSMRRATIRRKRFFASASISIHALHEESDLYLHVRFGGHYRFQSTLSMRRATPLAHKLSGLIIYFNPRSP